MVSGQVPQGWREPTPDEHAFYSALVSGPFYMLSGGEWDLPRPHLHLETRDCLSWVTDSDGVMRWRKELGPEELRRYLEMALEADGSIYPLEDGQPLENATVVMYVTDDGMPDHFARRSSVPGWWESKVGLNNVLLHRIDDLISIKPKFFYRRDPSRPSSLPGRPPRSGT